MPVGGGIPYQGVGRVGVRGGGGVFNLVSLSNPVASGVIAYIKKLVFSVDPVVVGAGEVGVIYGRRVAGGAAPATLVDAVQPAIDSNDPDSTCTIGSAISATGAQAGASQQHGRIQARPAQNVTVEFPKPIMLRADERYYCLPQTDDPLDVVVFWTERPE